MLSSGLVAFRSSLVEPCSTLFGSGSRIETSPRESTFVLNIWPLRRDHEDRRSGFHRDGTVRQFNAGSAKRFLSPADRNRRTGGVAAQNRDAMSALNLRLVPRLASRFQGYGTSYEDLVKVGRSASRRFIPPSVRRQRRFRCRLERSGAPRPGRLPAESRTQRRLRSGRRVSRRTRVHPETTTRST